MDFIKQFLDSEIMDLETYKIIYDFIALDNFRFGEYEGNQYVIRKINNNHIQIEDEVATETTGIPRIELYRRGKLLHILENYKDTI
ncbi:hypothetical protein [Cytobacillus purgationiresistens]|uniref:Uncharacterized protein n=1 Tax=Cytobacillus purgationiresistens TaxID=863449 RepID=A0ABU0AJ40_9BACI|nr:hypothetical protein [Cytobacillus purgationiresistens]MDQ0271273.1 hypothetical protein [Cytobacillus purgationiresistens]